MHWSVNLNLAGQIVDRALEEDIGQGDLSTWPLFPVEARSKAVIAAKQAGVMAGLPIAELTFKRLDPQLSWCACRDEGAGVRPGERIAEIQGSIRAMLTGERVALNFLQRLCGIATLTRRFVDAVSGFNVKILDTRKTAPGVRVLDKYAVRVGGGFNHRFGLYDGILIKDNHVRAAGGIGRVVALLREKSSPLFKIEVEASCLKQVEEALHAGADVIMLDNMSPKEMAEAVRMSDHRALVEASGGVTLETVREIAATGVDCISVGALTHSVQALDLSLEVIER